jgi:hypothetical protein
MFKTETLNLELELESPEHLELLELLEQPTLHQNIHPEPEPLKKGFPTTLFHHTIKCTM